MSMKEKAIEACAAIKTMIASLEDLLDKGCGIENAWLFQNPYEECKIIASFSPRTCRAGKGCDLSPVRPDVFDIHLYENWGDGVCLRVTLSGAALQNPEVVYWESYEPHQSLGEADIDEDILISFASLALGIWDRA
jgi:hypothetical protein